MPHIVLDARANDRIRSDLPQRLSRATALSLEGDFDRHFRAYAPEGRAADSLSVLTPDLMAALLDTATDLDVEFAADTLRFYRPGQADVEDPRFWQRVQRVLDTVGPVALRQTDHYTDATTGSDDLTARVSPLRLFARRHTGGIATAGVLLYLVAMALLGWALSR